MLCATFPDSPEMFDTWTPVAIAFVWLSQHIVFGILKGLDKLGAWYDKFWLQPLAAVFFQITWEIRSMRLESWSLIYDFDSTSRTLYKYIYRLNYCAD